MEETSPTTEQVTDTTAPEQVGETQTAGTLIEEPASGATPVLDEYDQRIESLLQAHEQRKVQQDEQEEEAKKQETLREGESWQSVLDSAPDDVQRAMASIAYLGGNPTLGSGSTNSNIPFSKQVPAVTIGRGGEGKNAHALNEWWMNKNGDLAIKNAFLILLSTAELDI